MNCRQFNGGSCRIGMLEGKKVQANNECCLILLFICCWLRIIYIT